MARIDFHSNVGDKLDYVCRLTRKIWSSTAEGQPVRPIVIVANNAELQRPDDLLWPFSNCAVNSLQAIPHADILIQLGQEMPSDITALVERFPRIVEVVTTHEAERLAGRNRFKTYRDLGHELHNFDQTKT